MKKRVEFCLAVLLVFALCFAGCVTREQAQQSQGAEPTPAGSAEPTAEPTPEPTPSPLPYEQAAVLDPVDYSYCENDSDVFDAVEMIRANAAAAPGSLPALSGTNLSDGCQSGDTVTSDDNCIYLLADTDLVIVKADGENTQILSRTPVGVSWKGETDNATGAYRGREKVPSAVFCAGGRVVVLSDRYGYDAAGGAMEYTETVSVDIFDVTDPAAPVLTASLGQDGILREASVHDNALILITEYQIYEDARREQAGDYIPSYYSGDSATLLSGDRICADKEGTFPGSAVLGVYDLAQGRLSDIQAFLGLSADAAMNQDTIVFFSPRRAESFSRDVNTPQGSGRESVSAACTDLFVVKVENKSITLSRVGAVNGTVSGSGCLDLYNGSIRCLSSLDQRRYTVYGGGEPVEDESVTGSAVYLLDDSLEITDTIEALSDGSRIGWAGFAGDRILLTNEDRTASCAADLSQDSVQLGGVTQALTGRYIRRFGENAYVLYDQNERGKMTLTLCDGTMKQLSNKVFGSDHSSSLENHRAYLTDAEADLLTLTADDSYCIYGYNEEQGIFLRADVYLNDWPWNAEGIRIGEYLYIVDTKDVRVLSLSELKELTSLPL